jgi:farnesyl diphosphate synthase
VHDDLPAMDDDDLHGASPRRTKFDEATAMQGFLLTLAFEILAHGETHADAEVRSALVLELAQASGMNGMAGGQMLDMGGEKGPFTGTSSASRPKTGSSSAAAKLGHHGGADARRRYADDMARLSNHR